MERDLLIECTSTLLKYLMLGKVYFSKTAQKTIIVDQYGRVLIKGENEECVPAGFVADISFLQKEAYSMTLKEYEEIRSQIQEKVFIKR